MREYTTREAAELLRVSADAVRAYVRRGWVVPKRNQHRHYRFSFQDLVLLKTARDLANSSLSKRRVGKALKALRERLPKGQPLSTVRIIIDGDRVVVRDRGAPYEPESGQSVLDFSVGELANRVAPLIKDSAERAAVTADSAQSWYELGVDYELMGSSDEAERAYRRALQLDPNFVNPYVNLGRLLHRQLNLTDAEALYRKAMAAEPANAVAHFNLGVVLEDRDEKDAAMQAYRDSLRLDPTVADAHYNLARLLEQNGDLKSALRHLNAFRRLTR